MDYCRSGGGGAGNPGKMTIKKGAIINTRQDSHTVIAIVPPAQQARMHTDSIPLGIPNGPIKAAYGLQGIYSLVIVFFLNCALLQSVGEIPVYNIAMKPDHLNPVSLGPISYSYAENANS